MNSYRAQQRKIGMAFGDDVIASRLLDVQLAIAERDLAAVTGAGAAERVAPKPAAPKPALSVLAATRYVELQNAGHTPEHLSGDFNVKYLLKASDPVRAADVAAIAAEDVRRTKRKEPAARPYPPLPAAERAVSSQVRAVIEKNIHDAKMMGMGPESQTKLRAKLERISMGDRR